MLRGLGFGTLGLRAEASKPGLALTDDDEKNLNEIYDVLASPAIAHTQTSQQRFDPVQFCLLLQKWPEDKRFPCKSSLVTFPGPRVK